MASGMHRSQNQLFDSSCCTALCLLDRHAYPTLLDSRQICAQQFVTHMCTKLRTHKRHKVGCDLTVPVVQDVCSTPVAPNSSGSKQVNPTNRVDGIYNHATGLQTIMVAQ